ncbi:anti-sigma factor family protein [Micromonospora sp. DT4]|uniref:anti-sigma factor family protein n=1 Tax=Micromonospora sp. DT4 TaxID=3393438 RepID=UPI003CFA820A
MDTFLRCDAVVSLTMRLIDSTVSPERRELVELHLLVCPACMGHVGKMRALRTSLSGLPGRPAPEHLLALAAGPASRVAVRPTTAIAPPERTTP